MLRATPVARQMEMIGLGYAASKAVSAWCTDFTCGKVSIVTTAARAEVLEPQRILLLGFTAFP